MKTLNELYNEVMASDELKKEFCALKPEQVEEFTAKHGCKATLDEVKAFLSEKVKASSQGEPGELSDSEIEQAAGGKSNREDETLMSVATLGLGCALYAVLSAAAGNCGTAIENSGMLCECDGKNILD